MWLSGDLLEGQRVGVEAMTAFDPLRMSRLGQLVGMTKANLGRGSIAVVLLVCVTWYWYVRSHAPTVGSVNGTYANACCKDLALRDGIIIAGDARIPFRLADMKFGLTAFPTRRLEVHAAQVVVVPGAEEGPLAFNRSRTAFSVCADAICKNEFTFVRR